MSSNPRQLQRTLQTRLTRKAEVLSRPGGTVQTQKMEVDVSKTAACICQRAKVGQRAVSNVIEVEVAGRGAVQ